MKENGVLNEEELCDHANGIDDKLCNADHESVRRAAAFSWAQKKPTGLQLHLTPIYNYANALLWLHNSYSCPSTASPVCFKVF